MSDEARFLDTSDGYKADDDATAEAREQIARALAERLNPRTGMSERAVVRLADAVLAVPAVAEALAAVERVRALLVEFEADRQSGTRIPADRLRRALDGEP